jgi:putative ABC transport system permease protein
MRWLNILSTRLRALLGRDSVIDDINEEMRLHVEMEAEANVARGMTEEEARRAALLAFGNVGIVRDSAYDVRGGGAMETLWQDLRFGARMLWKSPGFTLVAIVALALGIGANTAIFSVVDALLLRALPYRHANRLVVIWEHKSGGINKHNVVAPANFLDWQEQAQAFDEIAAFVDVRFNLTGMGAPVEVPAQVSTGNLFELLGAQAALGRTYTTADEEPGHDNVVVLSHELWQRQFGGDLAIVGKTLTMNGHAVTVIGVMPSDFKWFIKENSLTGKPAELWTPNRWTDRRRVGRFLSAVARLKPGVSVAQGQAEMDTIADRFEQQYPDFSKGWGVELVPVRTQLAGEITKPLLVLLGAVAFVLLIACANVANLMMARAAARQKEMAIRTALGAGRWRVVRQLLTESVMLALMGGVVGLLLALWGVDLLVSLSPPNLISRADVGLSLPVLGFTFGVSLLTGIIFGLLPALEAARSDPQEALKESGRSVMSSPRSRRVRSAFVIAEIALALVLLVGAGLMMKSFLRLAAVNPGFDAQKLLTMRVLLPRAKYPDDAKRIAFFRQAVERMQALPGVRAASAATELPFGGLGSATDFAIVGQPAPPAGNNQTTDVHATDENYFRTLNIPIIKGRTYTAQEATEDHHVVVINETLARQYFPDTNPIGQRLVIDMKDQNLPDEIIGIVGDAKYTTLEGEPHAMVYWPHSQLPNSAMTIVLRTTGDPMGYSPAAQREIQGLDKDQPVADVRTMESLIGESISRTRFGTLLLDVFAAVALLLATVGIYGVMAYSVVQRTHEIGIRMALGAQVSDIFRLVVSQGLLLILCGVALGLSAAFALTRLLASLLYGVSATDPTVFVGLSVLLTLVAFVASYVPARRATKVDPLIALRYE